MWDLSVENIGLKMRAKPLQPADGFALPEKYGWRFYRPGDEHVWAEIETSAGEFRAPEEGLPAFQRYFPSEEELRRRMIFLTDGGKPFATATAWFGGEGEPEQMGHLHWVSVDAAHQGRGLSKPLVAMAVNRLLEMGHREAILTTQTPSWVAIRVYHRFGFRPEVRAEEEIRGWSIVSEKTGIDFLSEIRR